MIPWTSLPTHRAWLDQHVRDLLDFGRAHVVAPGGGAAYLGDDGRPWTDRGVQTWITCRTVHVYALGAMLGVPGSAPVAAGALARCGGGSPLSLEWVKDAGLGSRKRDRRGDCAWCDWRRCCCWVRG